MIEHSDRRRRALNRRGAADWLSRRRRPLGAIAVASVIVIVAAGLSIALGGGGVAPDAVPSQPSLLPGVPVVTPPPTMGASFPPVSTPPPTMGATFPPVSTAPPAATNSPTLSQISSPSAGPGIRAERIQIDRLGIDLRIVEGDGIDAPIGKAAHYPGTGWPGSGTNIYIYGHARAGMFLALWDVAVGDQVILTLVDGTQRTYVVAKILPLVPWNAVTYLGATPTEQLTLQTSTSTGPTAPRFIAIAYPAP